MGTKISDENDKNSTIPRFPVVKSASGLHIINEKSCRTTHAAAAPSISCLLALVNRERATENESVAMTRIPIHAALFVLESVLLRIELT
jgi:hypothetical protein